MTAENVSIKAMVRTALTALSNGRDITAMDVVSWLHSSGISEAQVKRALRSIPYVARVAAGYYRIRGRSVRTRN